MRWISGAFVFFSFFFPALPQAHAQVGVLSPSAGTRMTLYAPDTAWVEEIRTVRLAAGANTLRLDFTQGKVDLDSVLVVPADHPAEVTLLETKRRADLPRTLFMEVDSKGEGKERFRIVYAIRGISAGVRYDLTYGQAAGSLEMVQYTDIDNRSGKDYVSTAARVVFGEVHTTGGGPTFGRSIEAGAAGEDARPPKEVLRQGFSEHELYTLPAPADYANGEVKSVRSLHALAVPVTLTYAYDPRKDASRVRRVLKGKNAPEGSPAPEGALGKETLPPGPWRLSLKVPSGKVRYIGTGSLPALPPGKEFKIEMGPDPDLAAERKLMDYRKVDLKFGEYNRQLVSFGTEETYRIEFRNHKKEDVEIVALEPIEGTGKWEIAESSLPWKKKDAGSIEFKAAVPAGGKVQVTYRVKKHGLTR